MRNKNEIVWHELKIKFNHRTMAKKMEGKIKKPLLMRIEPKKKRIELNEKKKIQVKSQH